MKKIIFGFIACSVLLCSCHESLEKRAQREAREYTEKYCPTPEQNYTRTDSVVFDINTKTYHYYCSVTGILDDKKIFDNNRQKLTEAFQWTLRSDKNKNVVYFDKRYTPKDYSK